MKRNRRLLLRSGLLMGVMMGAIAPVIHAATVTTTLPVTAAVGAACTVSATGVNFGSFMGAELTATGSISVTCSNGTPYNIGLNAGAHFGNVTTLARAVVSAGVGALAYRLYRDSGLAFEWGDSCLSGGVSHPALCKAGFGSGSASTHTVFGRLEVPPIPASPGGYSDTVLVTVIF